ncbi:CBS domain-containing protein [Halococcus hamelinensis]|uniref:Signal transduction protein with CBS domains n=1 Tax=Halococcus hamelinensis 100A6 TaxID=1132509 RepID=M0M3M2_9EURY|nr:CBS domain-containing protein [Halococcus hamelinensis]EMA39214.1 signal transduction protein with CBS domains [Halococcus hamelinensis 100A6]
MDDIFVGRLMSSDLHTVSPDTLVEEAANVMLEEGIGSVMVVDGNNDLQGILTTTDFVGIVAASSPKAETTVAKYMSTDVITTTVQDPITEVAETMLEHGFHHMPVVSDTDGVIGIITTADLTSYLSHVQTPSPS